MKQCKCWSVSHTFKSLVSDFIERKPVSECTSGGGFLQYTACKCKLCSREWDEG